MTGEATQFSSMKERVLDLFAKKKLCEDKALRVFDEKVGFCSGAWSSRSRARFGSSLAWRMGEKDPRSKVPRKTSLREEETAWQLISNE